MSNLKSKISNSLYLPGLCLVLIMTAAGCRKEPGPAAKKPAPDISRRQDAPGKSVTVKPASPVLAQARVLTENRATGKSLSTTSMEESAPDDAEYFAVFMAGKKVGYSIQSRIVADDKVTTSQKVNITISRAGTAVTMDVTESSIETTDGKPLGFEVEQVLGAMLMKIKGVVGGDGVVNATTTTMGQEQKKTIQWPSGAVLAEGLRLLTLEKGMKEGLEYTVKMFSPGILQAIDTKIRIGAKQNVDLLGRVVALTEVKSTLSIPGAGDIVSTGYVDEDFRIQKSIMPIAGMRVEMVACPRAFALGKNDVLDLIDKMFLASPVPLKKLGTTESITYHLVPKGGAKFKIPSSDNQKVEQLGDGKVAVTVKRIVAPAGARFPYRGKDKAVLEALEPTRFVQSDHEEIIELARRAVGSTRSAAGAVRKIEEFVAGYITGRSLSVGYATAVEVAASRQGDCSEFAVLTAAMCRAVGIPAQVVTGIAYVEEWAGMRNGFGGHAWVQAYVGGKWIGLDAAFKSGGRGGYDPGHIALAAGNGNPEDFFNLVTSLGAFKIDKVIVRK